MKIWNTEHRTTLTLSALLLSISACAIEPEDASTSAHQALGTLTCTLKHPVGWPKNSVVHCTELSTTWTQTMAPSQVVCGVSRNAVGFGHGEFCAVCNGDTGFFDFDESTFCLPGPGD